VGIEEQRRNGDTNGCVERLNKKGAKLFVLGLKKGG
jgi:hypothetical protein